MLQSKAIATFGSPTLGPLGLPLEKRKKEDLKKMRWGSCIKHGLKSN